MSDMTGVAKGNMKKVSWFKVLRPLAVTLLISAVGCGGKVQGNRQGGVQVGWKGLCLHRSGNQYVQLFRGRQERDSGL